MARSVGAAAKAAEPAPERLRRATLAILILLLIQYGLGMFVNLFIRLSRHHPGANAPEYFSGVVRSVTWAILHGPLLLTLHTVLGLVLVLATVGLAVQAWRSGITAVRWGAALGLVFTLAAGFNGGSFLNYGFNLSSYLMALLFGAAVLAYVLILFVLASPGGRLALPPSAPVTEP